MGVRIPPPLPCIDIDGQGWDDMGVLKRAQEFFGEVLGEFRKVTWPNRQELINSTVVVITVTVVIAFFLGGVDIVLARLVERILRWAEKRRRPRRTSNCSSCAR